MTTDEDSEMLDGLPNAVGPEQRVRLAKMVCRLFEHWGLDIASQLALLGLSSNSQTRIDLYGEDAALPDERDLLERGGNLLGMYKSLRLLFLHYRELAHRWPTTTNRAFVNRSPVEIMVEQGLPGILAIRRYLDAMRGQ
jgi:hypothetical protein